MSARKHTPKASQVQVGQRFGRWTVIGEPFTEFRKDPAVLCRCTCGTERVVVIYSLRSGNSKSCGCYKDEMTSKRRKKHGYAGTRIYKAWRDMMLRCYKENHKSFHNYGGRGIKVCPEWHTFLDFKEWSFSHGYGNGLSIDRINNDGDYEPRNCRWTDWGTQCRNTRRSRLITALGETKSVIEWSEDPRCSLSKNGLLYRLNQGMKPEVAITMPSRRGY